MRHEHAHNVAQDSYMTQLCLISVHAKMEPLIHWQSSIEANNITYAGQASKQHNVEPQ